MHRLKVDTIERLFMFRGCTGFSYLQYIKYIHVEYSLTNILKVFSSVPLREQIYRKSRV
jgi:hypothetical protein